MDPTAEAALALARGDALAALMRVGRATDPLGLLLRGIAYAQIGDLELARRALVRAADGRADPLIAARATSALAEVDLAAGQPSRARTAARRASVALAQLGDRRNAAMAKLVSARASVLLGDLDEARRDVASLRSPPPDIAAAQALVLAEIEARALSASSARTALARARRALARAPHELLARALAALERGLAAPVARVVEEGVVRPVDLDGVERARRADGVLVDACRREVVARGRAVLLARRPVVFALAVALARAWPGEVGRDDLLRDVFGARRIDDSHRVRLRVEITRLRKVLGGVAAPRATPRGYTLEARGPVRLLLPVDDGPEAQVGVLLADGAAWTASEIAELSGLSRRSVQRSLGVLVASGTVVRTGRGPTTRYASASGGIAPRMSLLGLVGGR